MPSLSSWVISDSLFVVHFLILPLFYITWGGFVLNDGVYGRLSE